MRLPGIYFRLGPVAVGVALGWVRTIERETARRDDAAEDDDQATRLRPTTTTEKPSESVPSRLWRAVRGGCSA